MRLAVLDYSNSDVDIIDDVPQMSDSDEIEEYLTETLNYNIDEIYWMDLSKGKVNFLTPEDFG